MTETDNDKLLRDFFAENKQEIANNGFSHRVIRHLPDRNRRLANIWNACMMTIAAALFIWMDGVEAVWQTSREMVIGMADHGVATLDPQSVLIATVVLLVMATRKIVSLA